MLQICNTSLFPVRVALMLYDADCVDGSNWVKQGWWTVVPGSCVNAYRENVTQRGKTLYYYAETLDKALSWYGPFITHIPPNDEHFKLCSKIARRQYRKVGFRRVNVEGFDDYTLTITS